MPKRIEDTYQKLTQREHVLHRSGMYIGSTKKQTEELWVADENSDGTIKMKKKMVEYSPGFMKIFDEILTNATDHSFRDSTVNIIKVDYNKLSGEISVWNNGKGIPVVLHKEHNIYVPELIFGHLLSGSNYNDNDTRTGAGTNGLGSKVVAIYSKKFIVETIDSDEKRRFVQEFTDNMENRTKPKITNNSGKSFTKITFIPDYSRFEMSGLEDDTILLIRKRVLDCIACTNSNVQIYLNDERLKGKGLTDYIGYFFDNEKIINESYTDRIQYSNGKIVEYTWEYAIVPYHQYEQVSFVNGNATIQGGKHVDYILYQIINRYKKMLEDKKKLKELKPNFIKDKLFVFLRSTVANPSFNSQTKEQLTTPSKDFGCIITVSDQFINKLYKSSITDEIVEFCKFKETSALSRQTDGKKTNKIYIPKLEDALWAGTSRSNECTLILTEGDSAKTFAMWGRSIVGPERYAVFPLKGKVINIRDASISQLIGNEEINNLKQIIGLKQDHIYKTTSELRYGRVMVLTDADCDGSHIKALLVNFFHYWWPSLIKLDYIQTLRTPIVKAIKGKKIMEFFTEQDYLKWKETGVNLNSYQIRYFKGLGTSKKEDAKETFRRLDELKIDYYYKDKLCDESILLAFDKDKNIKLKSNDNNSNEELEIVKCSDKRKVWLSNYDKNIYLDMNQNRVSYQDLINKELIHFSIYDNLRSIPSLCDGLKPSQRKILYYMLKKNKKDLIKVAQLSGYVSAETSYHHGEASLQGAIVNMAQDFVGSNNINLLYPDGNFGCLDPETDILMWSGKIKKAKDIKIGDKLVGDDGKHRNVLNLIQGRSNMYELELKNGDKYTVNEEHVLTLKYSRHKKIYWKESDKSWHANYFDNVEMKSKTKSFRTNMSTNNNHFNMSKLSKEQAYNKIKLFIDNITFPDIIDIKLSDYLRLSNTDKCYLYSIKNKTAIEWYDRSLPINPYILGVWLGDGNADGSGLTSADEEIIKEYVYYADTINCELVHDKNGIETKTTKYKTKGDIHENYHYGIRQKKSKINTAKRLSIGDVEHNSSICLGCMTSNKKSLICDFHFKKSDYIDNYCISKNVNGHNIKRNPWKQILINNNLYKNKHIPEDYIYNNKKNRLELLAGIIDTDGTVKFNNNIPKIEISQSYRLRRNLIIQLKFLCESLGYTCTLSYYQKSGFTTKDEDKSILTLNIMSDNLHEIPLRLFRKKIKPYNKISDSNLYSFTVKPLGKNIYNGWELDGNKRFLLGNYIVTHNSRLQCGKDAASPRYIFTRLSDITQDIFNPNDTPLLNFLNDDGVTIEPEWYLPIIPMILVNGCEGIGTGYSTFVPTFNPVDIIHNLIKMIDDDTFMPLPLKPYFRGFNGIVEETETGSYITKGRWERLSDYQIRITEIPVGTGVTNYKEFLESFIEKTVVKRTGDRDKTKQKKKNFELKDVQNKTIDENDNICFIVEFKNKTTLDNLIKSNTLEKELKLTKSFSTNNMYLFNENLILTKYKTPVDILLEFFDLRLEYYVKRKEYITKRLRRELEILTSKARFIKEYINGDLDINKRSKDYIISVLEEHNYPKDESSYDYLLRLPIYSLTSEKIKELEEQCHKKEKELKFILSKSPENLWKIDLNDLLKKLI